MPFTKLEESIFTCFPSDSKFLSKENQKELIATMFLCGYCCKTTSHFQYHNRSSTCVGYMTLYCDKCLYNWVVCSQCTFDKQPKSPTLRVQKRKRHNVIMSLSTMMCEHTIKVHNKEDSISSIESPDIFPNTDMFIEVNENEDYEMEALDEGLCLANSDASDDLSTSNEYNAKMKLKSQLCKVFPDVPDKHITRLNRHVRDIIFELNIHNCYSDYLIKKTWLKGSSYDDYKITKSDTDLFLRIIRQLIMNSRDEQGKIVDIYRRIEDRSEDIIQHLQQRIFHLESTIEKYDETFNLIDKSYLRERMIEPVQLSEENLATDVTSSNKFSNHLLPLPHTIQDARYLMEKDSSFVSGLLCPEIQINESDGYAFILPSRLLPMFVSSGLEFEHITDNTDISSLDLRSKYRSPDIYSILSKLQCTDIENEESSTGYDELDTCEVYNIGLGYWSDGCDVGGASKANRSLVKLVTIHVIHPTLTENHVFPVGFGNNKGDHEYVRSKILNDLYHLQKSKKLVYVPSLKKVVAVRFFLAFVIQDRVEHCDFTGFSAHSGTFSTVPGISSPFVIFSDRNEHSHSLCIQKSVASCSKCAEYRLKTFMEGDYCQSAKSNLHCMNCTDWDLLQVRFMPDSTYPLDADCYKKDTLMHAKIITFSSMISACDVIHENIYLHNWTKVKAQKYGQIECIKTSVIEDIYQYSRGIRSRTKSTAQRPIPQLPRILLPSGMTQSILRLDQCIVGVMHTLILNLGKHLLLTISELLSKVKMWTSFYSSSSVLLDDIRKLSLNWCKCYHYGSTDKPGSLWVSENYLAFALISKHIFSIMEQNNVEGKAIKNVVWAYNTLVSTIMCENEANAESCDKAEALAKIFLSYFNIMDNLVSAHNKNDKDSNMRKRKKRKKDISKIESTSCILNVLSVVDEMRKKGIQRNYWEGGLSGEGILRFVKPLVKRGLGQLGVYKCTLQKLYQFRAINNMIHNHDIMIDDQINTSEKEDSEDFWDKERYRRFHSYKTYLEIEQNIQENKTLSCAFYVTDKKFYLIFQQKKRKLVVELLLSNAEQKDSTCTFNVNLASFNSRKLMTELSKNHNDYVSVLALPFQKTTDNGNIKYFLFSEQHFEYNEHETWILPCLMPVKIQKDIERIVIWTKRSECQKYVGKKVLPLEGKYDGNVTSFHYKRGVIDRDNAIWTVKYVKSNSEQSNRSTYKRVEYTYDDLIKIVL